MAIQNIEHPERPEKISESLRSAMLQAGDMEKIRECWHSLSKELNFDGKWIEPEFIQKEGFSVEQERTDLKYFLNQIFNLIQRPNCACDSFVKAIFENDLLLSELDEAGIPCEFLLQTVRVTALTAQLQSISGDSKHLPVDNYVDINGYSWANEELSKLPHARKREEHGAKREEKGGKELEAVQLQARKDAVIAGIVRRMQEPSFEFTEEEKKLLREDFAYKLRAWKAFFESSEFIASKALDDFFLKKFPNEEISVELFKKFKEICENDKCLMRRNEYLPRILDIMNPESGWFSVLLINKSMKLINFKRSVCNNMCDWFKL